MPKKKKVNLEEIPADIFQEAIAPLNTPTFYIEGPPLKVRNFYPKENVSFLIRLKRKLIQRRINKLENTNERYDRWMMKVMSFKIENEKKIKKYKEELEQCR